MAWKQILKQIILGTLLVLLAPSVAFAGGQSSSTNYQVNEVFFGSGGALNACSSNYCSKQAAGEVAVGNTASPNFQAQGGFNTDRTPYIQVNVNNTSINLGTLTPTTTATATATFTVKSYLSDGYVVVNASPPPSNNGYTMHTPSTPTASATGTEQFGINLRANTSPIAFGQDLQNLPDNTFADGQYGTNYGTANVYMYNQGDTLAYSTKSSSYSKYTISYIFNISHITPGGTYTFNHVLVATGTY